MTDKINDFSYFQEKYSNFLLNISKQDQLANRVAFDVLGTSYQLQHTIGYKEFIDTTPDNHPQPKPPKPHIPKRKIIKRKNIKRK